MIREGHDVVEVNISGVYLMLDAHCILNLSWKKGEEKINWKKWKKHRFREVRLGRGELRGCNRNGIRRRRRDTKRGM